jgi:hypothetical protein
MPNEVGGMDTALPEEVADKMKALLAEYNGKEEKTFGDKLSDTFVSSWESLGTFFEYFAIFIVAVFPVLLLLGVIAVIVIIIIKLVKRNKRNKHND